ncbi:MAG: UDP-N-acetylmuramoyl-L-alanine--D-glutamate ligase [Lachnospiraceae bacterium]|nr:UDP-N-acetylmuramoyl-L-alanine--D-glutamate ligase [Lachnospiraceae bacterium]
MGKRFLVFGTGKSGIAASDLLLKKGEDFVLFEGNSAFDQEAFYKKNPSLQSIPMYVGELSDEVLESIDIAVLSPGVPTDLLIVEDMKRNNIEIWGEIELAYNFGKGRVVAITGTNGKTTTTALTGQIMASYFKDVRVVGNIGIPYTQKVYDSTDDTLFVAEVSSFQLETIHKFKPEVSAILNITPDHLNRHHTMENYIQAKEDVTKNQNKDNVCVLNYEDEVLRNFAKDCPAKVVFFSSFTVLEEGFYFKNESIYFASKGETIKVIDVNDLNILGLHNFENVMAACAMAMALGVPLANIVDTLKNFTAVEHRIEFVKEIDGVVYYNDSKGTNPDAAIKGISAMNRPTWLIGGGYDKGSEYDEWIEAFGDKVKGLVLIGQTAEKIKACAEKHGFTNVVILKEFKEAVDYCRAHAVAGEAVLLSPACASWGMFDNYEQRGRVFKDIIRDYGK